jgi:lipoprotein-anchoring transpeptidase ErfK/SrfK
LGSSTPNELRLGHARKSEFGPDRAQERIGADGLPWLRVMLPGRPNGRTGWIKERGTKTALTDWRIVVQLANRQVSVYRGGRVIQRFQAIVGKPSTPTPQGEFFVEESVQLSPDEAGAPFALALSARSNVYREFAGGPGQVALHGVANIGGLLGTAVSHGCVRLSTTAMRWLGARIGPGTPVTITD